MALLHGDVSHSDPVTVEEVYMDGRDGWQAHGAAEPQPMSGRGRYTRLVAGRLHWAARLLVATLAVGLLALVPCSQAADFVCTAGDVACLIQAINTANANGDANTITLEAGTYTLTASVSEPNCFECVGLPVLTSSLTITGPDAERTIIARDVNADSLFRILSVAPTGSLTLQGLTLRDGRARSRAGGILNEGRLTLVHTTVTANTVPFSFFGRGGGIYNTGTLALVHTTVTANNGGGQGGGIFMNDGSV